VEGVAFEFVLRELLEAAVGQPHRIVGHKPRLATLHDERRVLDRQPLGEVAVVGERRAAVTDAEDGRDEFHLVPLASLFHRVEPLEILRRLLAERVEAERRHRAVEAVLRAGVEHLRDLGDIAFLAESPAEDPDEPVGIRGGLCRKTDKQEQILHGNRTFAR
jgi:hypothetical protein